MNQHLVKRLKLSGTGEKDIKLQSKFKQKALQKPNLYQIRSSPSHGSREDSHDLRSSKKTKSRGVRSLKPKVKRTQEKNLQSEPKHNQPTQVS